VPYNPDIAAAFFRAGYIESWGRGIEKINDACEAAGTPLPVFNTEFSGLMVTFKSATVEETTSNATEKILELIRINPVITATALQKATGLSRRGVEWNLDKLKKENKLQRIGATKKGEWRIND
jgi:ATP-dependent DNA helicase RecG